MAKKIVPSSLDMSDLIIGQSGDVLVVDSRLIAERLEIEHHSFLKTIEEYGTQIEQAFGVLRFEIDKPPEGSKGGRPAKFALLTEDQAIFAMTLSRNTAAVIQCKIDLVVAFSKAKSQSKRRLTNEEIASLCILGSPAIHVRRFDEVFYQHLSRLTGLEAFGHKRPQLWGALTREFVYNCLPVGIAEGLRRSREAHGGWDKLHQYLSEDGIEVFEKHMTMLLTAMDLASSVNDVRRMLYRKFQKHYQYELFEDCRKDGTLTVAKALKEYGDAN